MTDITHWGKFYFPNAGGIENVTILLAKNASISGYRVSVVCFEKNREQLACDLLDGVRVFRWPAAVTLASQPLSLRYFFSAIKEGRQSKIVHLHAPNMLAALAAIFLGRKPKLILHWHSDVVGKGLLSKLFRPLEWLLLFRANSLICTSAMYAQHSPSLKSYQKKIAVIPIGVEDASIQHKTAALPKEIEQLIANRRVVLAVGRLVGYKGFNILIEATEQLPSDVIVLVVGSGPLKNELELKAIELGVDKKIFFLGYQSDQVLDVLHKKASVFCLPSIDRAEAFGVVLIQAMSYGLPIVTTEIPGSGVPWVNTHNKTGLNVAVADSKALAQACCHILNSESLRDSFSKKARERYESEFTDNLFVSRIFNLYKELLIQ